MAQIHMLKKVGALTFGKLADILFSLIQKLFRAEEIVRIGLVLDRYDLQDSIKSMECSRRMTNDMGLEIKSIILPVHYQDNGTNTFDRLMTKPTKWLCSSEDSDQPGHPSSLIRVFAVRMKKTWVLRYPLSAQ